MSQEEPIHDELKKQLQNLESSGALIELLGKRQDQLQRSVSEARDKVRSAFDCLHEVIRARELELSAKLEEAYSKSEYVNHIAQLQTLKETTATLGASEGDVVRDAIANIEKATDEAFKAAFTISSISAAFDDSEALTRMISEYGSVSVEERSALGNFRCTENRETEVRVAWDFEGDEHVPPGLLVYSVDSKKRSEKEGEEEGAASAYQERYRGEARECVVPEMEPGAMYDLRLNVELGGMAARGYAEVSSQALTRRIAPNGLIYCGGRLDYCKCGACGEVCGADDKGCQCLACTNLQWAYLSSIHKECPNGHGLKLRTIADLRSYHPELTCAICKRKPYYETLRHFFACSEYMLACTECLYFVCPCCVPRVALAPDHPALAAVSNAGAFEPVPGIQKWYRADGAIYCGRKMDQCKCGGGCDGYCGPDNGCPCDECLEDLRNVLANSHVTCKCLAKYKIVKASERKSLLFKTSCAECNRPITTTGWMGTLLIFHCDKCKRDICPNCAKNKVFFDAVPPNVYMYHPRLEKRVVQRPNRNVDDMPCV